MLKEKVPSLRDESTKPLPKNLEDEYLPYSTTKGRVEKNPRKPGVQIDLEDAYKDPSRRLGSDVFDPTYSIPTTNPAFDEEVTALRKGERIPAISEVINQHKEHNANKDDAFMQGVKRAKSMIGHVRGRKESDTNKSDSRKIFTNYNVSIFNWKSRNNFNRAQTFLSRY